MFGAGGDHWFRDRSAAGPDACLHEILAGNAAQCFVRPGLNMEPSCAKALVMGGDVSWHIGDRMIQHALVELIQQASPGTTIHCAASDRSRFGEAPPGAELVSTPLDLLKQPRRSLGYSTVVWGGGQLLQDNASLLKNPYWATVLAAFRRRTRGPLVGCGLGIGPLDTAWGRFFARRALRQLDALIVRDPTSEGLVRGLLRGPGPEVYLAPDPAVSGSVADSEIGERYLLEKEGVPATTGEIRVGVAVQPWHHPLRRLRPAQWLRAREATDVPEEPEVRMNHLAAAINRFAAARSVRCLFFPMYNAPWERDDLESARWAARLSTPSHILRMTTSPDVLRAAAGRCDLFLSLRLHGAVLSMSAGTPTAGIACASKVVDYYAATGQSAHVMTEEEMMAPGGDDRLADLLERLWRNAESVSKEVRAVQQRLRDETRIYPRVLEESRRKHAHTCGRRNTVGRRT